MSFSLCPGWLCVYPFTFLPKLALISTRAQWGLARAPQTRRVSIPDAPAPRPFPSLSALGIFPSRLAREYAEIDEDPQFYAVAARDRMGKHPRYLVASHPTG